MINALIVVDGVNATEFSSKLMEKSFMASILGLKVVVSNNVIANSAVVFVPQKACTFRQQTPITAKAIEDPGKGTLYRVWELGIATLTDPKSVSLITATAS